MERIKVAALVAIAISLVVQQAERFLPVAEAADGGTVCQTFVLPTYTRENMDKVLEDAAPANAALQQFFDQHPQATTVFQAQFPNLKSVPGLGQVVNGYVTLLCVH